MQRVAQDIVQISSDQISRLRVWVGELEAQFKTDHAERQESAA